MLTKLKTTVELTKAAETGLDRTLGGAGMPVPTGTGISDSNSGQWQGCPGRRGTCSS